MSPTKNCGKYSSERVTTSFSKGRAPATSATDAAAACIVTLSSSRSDAAAESTASTSTNTPERPCCITVKTSNAKWQVRATENHPRQAPRTEQSHGAQTTGANNSTHYDLPQGHPKATKGNGQGGRGKQEERRSVETPNRGKLFHGVPTLRHLLWLNHSSRYGSRLGLIEFRHGYLLNRHPESSTQITGELRMNLVRLLKMAPESAPSRRNPLRISTT